MTQGCISQHANRQIKIFQHCLPKYAQTSTFFGLFQTEGPEKQFDFACLFF